MTDRWTGCYSRGWLADIVLGAYSHPAKVSFKLAERIYQHALEQGWVRAGDVCLDCFGGVGCFGLHAMLNGLNFIGVELEPVFAALAEQNIALWQRKFRGLPNLGTAVVVRGDSRELCKVVGGADIVVGSPPFLAETGRKMQAEWHQKRATIGKRNSIFSQATYGSTPGQLGAIPEGNVDMVISSPPY